MDAVVLVGRVDRAYRLLERVDNVEDVIQLSNLRAIAGRRGELCRAGRVEVGEPRADGRV